MSGHDPQDVYIAAFKRVTDYLPFRTLEFREECAILLKEKLDGLNLIDTSGKINAERFLRFISQPSQESTQ